jgi:hypothetical protein
LFRAPASSALRIVISILSLAFTLQAQAGIPTWILSPAPTLTIQDDGTPAAQFVQVMGVGRLSTGGIAITNRGTNDVRIFDRTGRHVTTFGRTGSGPGEFRRIEWIGHAGDTAWFFDSGLQRVTTVLLSSKPQLLGTTPITATGDRGRFDVIGRLPDGRFVVTTNVQPTFDGPPGAHRLPGSAGIVARSGDGNVTWLGDFKSATIFAHHLTGDMSNAATGPIAFTPWLRTATSGGQIWIGDSAGDSVVVVRARDRSRLTVRLPFPRRAPTKELINGARDRELRGRPLKVGSFTEARYSPKYLPDWLPYFEGLVAGAQGEVWVSSYAGDRSMATFYIVIDSNGRPRGRVNVPAGSRIREAGLDYVILAHEDADGVESIRVHGLVRR